MVIHFFFEFFCMKIQYETFYIFERLGRMHENKIFFFVFPNIVFATFQRKSGILILDLYFYIIKIQTNINKKLV
jgi:hypothetical protein